jgi:hypothetical protein
MSVVMALDGATSTDVRMIPAEINGADPGKLIMRVENRLSGLESLKSLHFLSEIDQLTTEAGHARDDIARPFPQAGQLAAARDRVLRLEEKLRETTAPSRANGNDWLLAAAMHDATTMARIPGATVVTNHQDGQPQSPAQVSQCDFSVDNPLAEVVSAAGSAIPKPPDPDTERCPPH